MGRFFFFLLCSLPTPHGIALLADLEYLTLMVMVLLASSTWDFGNNLAYFQSQIHPEIDPTCRLCLQGNETLHHLMTDCKATTPLQMDMMKKQIPLPDMTWSVRDINKFIQHPLIHSLMTYNTQYNNRDIEYIDHNYSSDASSLWVDPLMLLRRRSWCWVLWGIRTV